MVCFVESERTTFQRHYSLPTHTQTEFSHTNPYTPRPARVHPTHIRPHSAHTSPDPAQTEHRKTFPLSHPRLATTTETTTASTLVNTFRTMFHVLCFSPHHRNAKWDSPLLSRCQRRNLIYFLKKLLVLANRALPRAVLPPTAWNPLMFKALRAFCKAAVHFWMRL
jgi:hypothetical protein